MREALGRGRSPARKLFHPLPDKRGDQSRGATPLAAAAAGPRPCGTFRRPSRTVRVEPVRRPSKEERTAPPRERSTAPPRERASNPGRRAGTREHRS
jgi:hypothetical protein